MYKKIGLILFLIVLVVMPCYAELNAILKYQLNLNKLR